MEFRTAKAHVCLIRMNLGNVPHWKKSIPIYYTHISSNSFSCFEKVSLIKLISHHITSLALRILCLDFMHAINLKSSNLNWVVEVHKWFLIIFARYRTDLNFHVIASDIFKYVFFFWCIFHFKSILLLESKWNAIFVLVQMVERKSLHKTLTENEILTFRIPVFDFITTGWFIELLYVWFDCGEIQIRLNRYCWWCSDANEWIA